MKQTRILKRTYPGGNITYTIQQKHFLFRWWWVDAWVNSGIGVQCIDTFDTMIEARENLCHFDGTPIKKQVV